MSKKEREEMQVKKETAESKPMMILVSRYSVRDPNVLASIGSFDVQQTRTVRVVKGAG